MRKFSVLLILLLFVNLFGCASKKPAATNNDTENGALDGQTELANPFIDCDTVEDAEALAGFEIDEPSFLGDYKLFTLNAIKDYMIQLIYVSGDDTKIYLRKAKGSDDISGDYTECDYTETVKVNGYDVTFKIRNDDIYTAIWQRDNYTYSLTSQSVGLNRDTIIRYIMKVD